MVIVAALTGGVIGWQSCETRKAAEASRDTIALVLSKERPRISVSPPVGDLSLNMLQLIWMDPINVDISNDGFTQALNVSAHGGVFAIESSAPPPMEKLRNLAIPTIIKAESAPISAALHFVDGLMVGGADETPEMFFIHAIGRITYEDFLGASYETIFKFRIQMARFNDETAISVLGWQRRDPETNDRKP